MKLSQNPASTLRPALALPWVLALLLASSMLMLAACSKDTKTTPDPQTAIVEQLRKNAEEFQYAIGKPGGALTSATISEPLTFNLAIAADASSSGVLGYLFDGLTEISWLTDQVKPSLAESWERSDDGLTWTFHIRRDVRWHDGQPFTAHDVDFTSTASSTTTTSPPPAARPSTFDTLTRIAANGRSHP